jgi:ABC-type polysaccharide/polyol phosphate transport system ATPase subunit
VSTGTAVRVDSVAKTFRIPHERVHTLKERVLHPLRRRSFEDLAALRNITFEVPSGEFFGIVGRNGSGKSTLLKCMAGIYATDRGRIYVAGRLSTFIELGVGFNVDLAARDNVMLNATMLGLTPREARRRFDAVIDFAELHDFVDLKLKNYSSGMLVRLAFAVMIQVDADVLMIDEVLAVGDAAFQQKCYDEFARLRKDGATVLLVTHDMSAVQRFCDRAVLLERGAMVELGGTEFVANRYLELNFGERARAAQGDQAERWGDARARIVDAWVEDEHGRRTGTLSTGRACDHVMRVVFAEDVVDPVFSLTVENADGAVMMTCDEGVREATGAFRAGEEVVVRFRFDNLLAPGRYLLTPAVADGGGWRWLDRPTHLHTMTVTGTRATQGLLELPFAAELVRGRAGTPSETVP